MKKQYIREQKHICGANEKAASYMEVDIVPVTAREHRASTRSKLRKASSIVQNDLNGKNARRHFIQLAHTNFTEDDFVVHLTYNDDNLPGSEEEAERCLANFIRRLNNRRRQLGLPPCKYLGVNERSAKGRYHHHYLMDGLLPGKEIKKLWSTGRGKNTQRIGLVRIDTLDFEGANGSIVGLCEYMLKDPLGRRRWRQSTGLMPPKRPRPNDTKYTQAKLAKLAKERVDDLSYWRQKYPGWELCESAIDARYNDFTGWSIYLRLRQLRTPNKGGQP